MSPGDALTYSSPLICAVIGGWISHLVSKKKSLAEIEKIQSEKKLTDIQGIEAIIEVYKEIATELRKELDINKQITLVLREQVDRLSIEVHNLHNENTSLKIEMKKFETLLIEKK